MKFEIKPYIAVENIEYQTLATEIMLFSIEELEEISKTMKDVLCGEFSNSSFSQNVILVEYDKNEASIYQFDKIVGKERTIDIYTLLIEFTTMMKKSRNTSTEE